MPISYTSALNGLLVTMTYLSMIYLSGPAYIGTWTLRVWFQGQRRAFSVEQRAQTLLLGDFGPLDLSGLLKLLEGHYLKDATVDDVNPALP